MWMWSGASVENTPTMQEDLGLILHPSPGKEFLEALISLLSDNRLLNNFYYLQYCDVKLK